MSSAVGYQADLVLYDLVARFVEDLEPLVQGACGVVGGLAEVKGKRLGRLEKGERRFLFGRVAVVRKGRAKQC